MTDHVHDDCVQCLQREVRDLKKELVIAKADSITERLSSFFVIADETKDGEFHKNWVLRVLGEYMCSAVDESTVERERHRLFAEACKLLGVEQVEGSSVAEPGQRVLGGVK